METYLSDIQINKRYNSIASKNNVTICNDKLSYFNSKQNEVITLALSQFHTTKLAKGYALFVTWTFANAHLPKYYGVPCFDRLLFGRYIDRLKHSFKRIYGVDIAYLVVSEFGGELKRPHHHGVIYINGNVPYDEARNLISFLWSVPPSKTDKSKVYDVEKYGIVNFGKDGQEKPDYGVITTSGAIKYVCKYICKDMAFANVYKNEIECFQRFSRICRYLETRYSHRVMPANVYSKYLIMRYECALFRNARPFYITSHKFGYTDLLNQNMQDLLRNTCKVQDTKEVTRSVPYRILRRLFCDVVKIASVTKNGYFNGIFVGSEEKPLYYWRKNLNYKVYLRNQVARKSLDYSDIFNKSYFDFFNVQIKSKESKINVNLLGLFDELKKHYDIGFEVNNKFYNSFRESYNIDYFVRGYLYHAFYKDFDFRPFFADFVAFETFFKSSTIEELINFIPIDTDIYVYTLADVVFTKKLELLHKSSLYFSKLDCDFTRFSLLFKLRNSLLNLFLNKVFYKNKQVFDENFWQNFKKCLTLQCNKGKGAFVYQRRGSAFQLIKTN